MRMLHGYPRHEVMRHMLAWTEFRALPLTRASQMIDKRMGHVLCATMIIQYNTVSLEEGPTISSLFISTPIHQKELI